MRTLTEHLRVRSGSLDNNCPVLHICTTFQLTRSQVKTQFTMESSISQQWSPDNFTPFQMEHPGMTFSSHHLSYQSESSASHFCHFYQPTPSLCLLQIFGSSAILPPLLIIIIINPNMCKNHF